MIEKTAVAAVITDHCGSRIHLAMPDMCTCSRIERVPAPSETTAFKAFDSAADCSEHLAADGEAEAADAVGIDVRPVAEESERRLEVPVAGPAER